MRVNIQLAYRQDQTAIKALFSLLAKVTDSMRRLYNCRVFIES